MADTTLTQTGAQVQADLDKVEGLANIKTVGSGLSLSAGGELSASSNNVSSNIEGHTITLGTSYANIYFVAWLDSSLKPHAIHLRGTANITNASLTDVYKIVRFSASKEITGGFDNSPNYISSSTANAIVSFKENANWSGNYFGLGYMGTGSGAYSFENSSSDEKDWYVLADTTLDVAFYGGGSGN